MMEFLVTSKARRRLLLLLIVEGQRMSVAALARLACVGYARAHREVASMKRLGLVVHEHDRISLVETHPCVPALRTLLTHQQARPGDTVRGELVTLGAPLYDAALPVACVEDTLVRAVRASRCDGTMASVLPVCFYRQRDVVRPEMLTSQAAIYDERRALGFFLSMTARLSGDRRFDAWARLLTDKRWSTKEFFFAGDDGSPVRRELARRNTPKSARAWGLKMNMGDDAFESMFRKHAHA